MYFLKIESQEAKLFCLKGFKGHYQPALLHHWVQGSSAGRKSLSINIYGWMLASVHHELAKTLQEGMILQFFGRSIMSNVQLPFQLAVMALSGNTNMSSWIPL